MTPREVAQLFQELHQGYPRHEQGLTMDCDLADVYVVQQKDLLKQYEWRNHHSRRRDARALHENAKVIRRYEDLLDVIARTLTGEQASGRQPLPSWRYEQLEGLRESDVPI